MGSSWRVLIRFQRLRRINTCRTPRGNPRRERGDDEDGDHRARERRAVDRAHLEREALEELVEQEYEAATAQVTYRSDKAEGPTAGSETVDGVRCER